jgi:hypothetical protein
MSTPTPPDPFDYELPKAPTRSELIDRAKAWMKERKEYYSEESYFVRLGLLVDFITDITPE